DAGTGRGNRGEIGRGWCRERGSSGVGYGARQDRVGGGRVLNGGAVEIERGHRQVGRVLPGQHRVAEGQRARAGPGQVGGGAAVVERQRRRAARGVDRDVLAEIDRQGDDVAGIQIAAAVGDAGTGRGNRG